MTDTPPPQGWLDDSPPVIMMPGPEGFTLRGPNGNLVRIDLKTGHVTLAPGMTPDEGAKAFWKAVEEMGGKRKCVP